MRLAAKMEYDFVDFGRLRAPVVTARYPLVECGFGDAAPRDNRSVVRYENAVIPGRFPVSNESAPGLSHRARFGAIVLLSILLWLPIIGALWMLLG